MVDSHELSMESAKLIASKKYTDVLKGNAKEYDYYPHVAFPAIDINVDKDDSISLDRVVALKFDSETLKLMEKSKIALESKN